MNRSCVQDHKRSKHSTKNLDKKIALIQRFFFDKYFVVLQIGYKRYLPSSFKILVLLLMYFKIMYNKDDKTAAVIKNPL